ncbi:LssY C-terminal domain-containing protein [Bryobacter aggregatus]|uniref:LssY C-terminal domain-containing protein n=1 Tax=Bryobacter aggregatus TaxID=360054 RepID=UPI0004E250E1|nr:LssY C-terminal domain-containing protein [Bryobacter aggregatus]
MTRVLLAICILFASPLTAVEVPAGARLEIRLRHAIHSFSAKAGSPVEAVLIAPVLHNDSILVPAGSLIHGTLTAVQRVGLGLVHERASLSFNFSHLELPNGSIVPIETRVTQIENARENVTSKGAIRGIRSTNTPGYRAAGVLTGFAAVDPIALIFSTAAFASVLRFSEPEISWPTGAELTLSVLKAFESGMEEDAYLYPVADTEDARLELTAMLRRMPYQTRQMVSGKLSDLTNLVFLGPQDAVERAFRAAGWVQSLAPTAAIQYKTLRAFAESQSFQEAPMSRLVLEGEQATLTLSKSLGTFSKRHHLRLYPHNETWADKPVWAASATQDTAIVISTSQRRIIHRIDDNIDEERSKVFNDLWFTGCVDSAELVDRPWVIENATNGTGQHLVTDRAIAVLKINDCHNPRRFDESNGVEAGAYRGSPVLRATRQTILTLRNDVVRGNLIWQGAAWAYQVARLMGKKPSDAERIPRQSLLGISHLSSPQWTPSDWSESSGGIGNRLVAPAIQNTRPRGAPTLGAGTDWETPSVELSFSLGTSMFSKSTVGEEALILSRESTVTGGRLQLSVTAGNRISPGFALGGSVTVHANRWMSHELGFHYLRGNYELGLRKLVPSGSEEVPGVVEQKAGLLTRQFSYNTLVHVRPIESRFRPYLAVGPALQLVHLTNAPFEKARGIFRFGLSNVGMVQAAYNFGSAPPLEGGGIFQPAFQTGAGIKIRVAKCWIWRFDYRSTFSQRPDFLKKSLATALGNEDPALNPQLNTLASEKAHSIFAQQRLTMGFSFTF